MPIFNQSRKNIIIAIFVAMCLIIIGQLLNLQVITKKYSVLAEEQGKFRKVIYPDRGLLFDRKGRPILQNTIIYDLMVTPSKIKGVDTMALCRILEIDTAEFRKRIVSAIIKNKAFRPSVFEALLSEEKIAKLNENMYKFVPAFDLQERPVRDYPYDAAGNILGYLSEVDTSFLNRHPHEGYQMGDYAGKTGVERIYEKVLMGQRGIEFWLRDNKNRLTGRVENGLYDTPAVAGKNMYLGLDIELQQLGEKLMQNKVGSIVVLDPKTGVVLAMISSPTYKPKFLTGAERKKHYAELLLDPRIPLMNRAVNATYSPGSTFKTLQALIGLQEGVITPSTHFLCTGAYLGCEKPLKCLDPGYFDLKGAITVSCNTYFANVMQRTINNRAYGSLDSAFRVWDSYMHAFGLGHRLGIDIPSEKKGKIPTPETYTKMYGKGHWNFCTFKSVSIGQGEVDVTPLQVANEMAYLANKGWYITPHLVDSIEGGDKYHMLDSFKMRHTAVDIPDSMFDAVHDGMQGVMETGTGSAAKVPGIVVCGKTGTVENYYKGEKQKSHAFFAAFAPRENPRIAIAVICENAGFGANSAAPIAGLMIEKYLKDSIAGPERQAKMEELSQLNLMPERMYKQIRERDSLMHLKDSSSMKAKGFIKGYINSAKDTLGLEEEDETEGLDKLKKANQKEDSSKKKKQDDSIRMPVAILHEQKKKSSGIDTSKHKR